jgi:hypothetical protein
MIDEIVGDNRPGDPIRLFLLANVFRHDVPEIYELGLAAYEASVAGDGPNAKEARDRFLGASTIIRKELTLLKNLSDHRVRSSATVTISHAQNFVRSRNPVTVIIKIESTILTGDPRLGAAPQ